MEWPNLRIDVSVMTDTKSRSMLANAIDDRGIIVACAGGLLLEHPMKQPLLYVVYAGAGIRLIRTKGSSPSWCTD
jgi:hypothetical protein